MPKGEDRARRRSGPTCRQSGKSILCRQSRLRLDVRSMKAKRAEAGRVGKPAKPRQRTLPNPPDPATVTGESVLVSPQGTRYRVLRTNQVDEYEEGDDSK